MSTEDKKIVPFPGGDGNEQIMADRNGRIRGFGGLHSGPGNIWGSACLREWLFRCLLLLWDLF